MMPELWHCCVYLSLAKIKMRFPDVDSEQMGLQIAAEEQNQPLEPSLKQTRYHLLAFPP